MLLVVTILNLIVGTLTGIAGIAGFLLPIVFVGYLHMDLNTALTLSFVSFLTSGVIGTYRYYKSGQMNFKFGLLISIGSFIGAILGVKLNHIIPTETAKLFLYMVVLLSGISILVRKNESKKKESNSLLDNKIVVISLGFITAVICALSGAGGPVLVMPILVSLGMSIRLAVGVSLFNSIFIAIPSCVGYFLEADKTGIGILLILSIVFQGIGVFFGSKIANKINVAILKKSVAIFSIGIAVYMIIINL